MINILHKVLIFMQKLVSLICKKKKIFLKYTDYKIKFSLILKSHYSLSLLYKRYINTVT